MSTVSALRGTRVEVRPMRHADLSATERTSDALFLDADRRTRRVGEPEPQPRSPEAAAQWIERMSHFLDVDPDGCWVADDGGEIVGFAISQNRDNLWFLATYGVRTDWQGLGIGRGLLDKALAHGGARPGLFSSTTHPGATRRYRLAGFTLHPQMRMVGVVDRSTLPALSGLREGRLDDLEWMNLIDERIRGAGHCSDHEFMSARMRLVVSSRRRGYAYIDDRGRPALLAATDEGTAKVLLWEALGASSGETLVNCVTTANHWAIDVGLAARLDLGQVGYLALRDLAEPAPYLASGHFL
jgi:ribosomal protein S18 acetylase RimI-like enzyme